jgi:hypothetical protein
VSIHSEVRFLEGAFDVYLGLIEKLRY